MKNRIEDLRNHLFATLEGLQDTDNPMDLDRAKAIADVAKVIVESAKAETHYIKITGGKGTDFIPDSPRGPQPLLPTRPNGEDKRLS